jgi:hypothetical protein
MTWLDFLRAAIFHSINRYPNPCDVLARAKTTVDELDAGLFDFFGRP